MVVLVSGTENRVCLWGKKEGAFQNFSEMLLLYLKGRLIGAGPAGAHCPARWGWS